MQHVFVYGTLLLPEIVQKLTGKVFETTPAVLCGFKRHRINGCDYPAIVSNKKAKVEGLLLRNVDRRSMKILTFFEGNEYQSDIAKVEVEKERIEAIFFLWNGNPELLSDFDWSLQQFEKEFLRVYLDEIIPETVNEFNKIRGLI